MKIDPITIIIQFQFILKKFYIGFNSFLRNLFFEAQKNDSIDWSIWLINQSIFSHSLFPFFNHFENKNYQKTASFRQKKRQSFDDDDNNNHKKQLKKRERKTSSSSSIFGNFFCCCCWFGFGRLIMRKIYDQLMKIIIIILSY